MVRLINDMLDLRKLEAGKLEFRTAEVPAADVVSAALRATTGMAQDFGVTVKQGASEEVHVKCDLDRLSRVLTNLISNAIKFSKPGETVTVEVRRTAGKVRFEVTDMGPGISAEQTSTLFRDFVQLNTVEGRADLGTGLGLAISKGIVEEHDGAIGVNSQIGKGSTFWFELPAAT
jgi:signal transduction histidine kinase